MKTEIETRFLEIDKDSLVSKLRDLGATDQGERKLDEVIFYDKDLKWLQGKQFVKLRSTGEKTKLIFKRNSDRTIDGAKEIEFEVSSMIEAQEFLEEIGLLAYRTIEKYRHTFTLNGVTIDIDTWPQIPIYAELEGDSVEALQALVRDLGWSWEDRFDGDPRVVYRKYGFDLDSIRTVTFSKFE